MTLHHLKGEGTSFISSVTNHFARIFANFCKTLFWALTSTSHIKKTFDLFHLAKNRINLVTFMLHNTSKLCKNVFCRSNKKVKEYFANYQFLFFVLVPSSTVSFAPHKVCNLLWISFSLDDLGKLEKSWTQFWTKYGSFTDFWHKCEEPLIFKNVHLG